MYKYWFFLLYGYRVISLICGEKCGFWCICLIFNFYKKYFVVGNLWYYIKVIGGGVVVGGFAVVAVFFVLFAVGFIVGGIAVGLFVL